MASAEPKIRPLLSGALAISRHAIASTPRLPQANTIEHAALVAAHVPSAEGPRK
jgi:hypothetical protein